MMLGAALSLMVAGCGAISGPSDKQIEDLARQEMIRNPGTDDPAQRAVMAAAARDATISKKGLCNTSKPDVYACMVDVTVKLPNAPEAKQTMVVEIGKSADGGWKVVE
ncbi:hypothetical protein AWL63_08225 [Sphingomonas panacis]|uniref:Uncharacterized protein n=2 Tax=Sphingomonas panacis TaxID=1560345 RepID=A0A1B3Z925_9SPHN|nr:hypothetical protein AWL63_08225 [Sphingomonas panacis]